MKLKKILCSGLTGIWLLSLVTGCRQTPIDATSTDVSGASSASQNLYADYSTESNGIYKLVSTASGRVLGAHNFGMSAGALVEQRGYQGDLNQLWAIQKQEDGTFKFKNLSSGMYMEVKRGATKDNAVVGVNLSSNEKSQKWYIDLQNDDTVKIRSAISKKPLQLEDNSTYAGAVAVIYQDTEESSQLFMLELVDNSGRQLPQMLVLSGDLEHSSCPEIVKFGNTYYSYNMGTGVPIRKSTDLKEWETVASALPSSGFSWLQSEVSGGSVWSPGVYKVGDQYRLYYSVSKSGQNSCIAMAVNETLDPTADNFQWKDGGVIIRSKTGDNYNAIDPNVITDGNGQPWLVFGSYWGGIMAHKLDRETGLLSQQDTTLYNLARRPESEGTAIEAPFMIQHGDYYYLFAAFNRMDTTYHFVVGRSQNILGPFVDKDGKQMLEGGGTDVTYGKPGVDLPGHCSVFCDEDGQYYLVGEYWIGNGSGAMLMVGTMLWDNEGWPITALTPNLFPQ